MESQFVEKIPDPDPLPLSEPDHNEDEPIRTKQQVFWV